MKSFGLNSIAGWKEIDREWEDGVQDVIQVRLILATIVLLTESKAKPIFNWSLVGARCACSFRRTNICRWINKLNLMIALFIVCYFAWITKVIIFARHWLSLARASTVTNQQCRRLRFAADIFEVRAKHSHRVCSTNIDKWIYTVSIFQCLSFSSNRLRQTFASVCIVIIIYRSHGKGYITSRDVRAMPVPVRQCRFTCY